MSNYEPLPTTPPSTPILISTTYNLSDPQVLDIVTEEPEGFIEKPPRQDLEGGRDPTHIREEAVEENGDEYIPHAEYYEGQEDVSPPTHPSLVKSQALALAGKVDPDAQALVPVANSKYYTMAVLPGRGVRTCIDVSSLIIVLFLVVLQFGVIDYYYISLKDSDYSSIYWYAWIGPDSVVLVVFLVAAICAIKYNRTQMEEVCSVDGKMKFAWIAWLVYSLVLVGKIAVCFRLFHGEVLPAKTDNNDKLFDDMLFKLTLSLSFLIFAFLMEAHHYTPLRSPRQLYLSYLATAICLDLVDNIYFLDLLWQAHPERDTWRLELWLEIAILAVSCVNFVMPTFALFKLRFGRFPGYFLVSDKIWAFLYVLVVNGPVLGLRIYLYILLEVQRYGHKYDPSLFPLKNVLMIYIAIRELWTRLQYWRMKRRATGSRGELTAHNPDEEN